MSVLVADTRSSYADVAGLYDAWVESPGYESWITGLVRLARDHGLGGARVLDVGCGTGLSTLPLVELGLDVTACDPAPEMLARAEAKLGARARLVAAGLPHLPALGEFDLVLAANDVVNHLAAEELRDAIAAMASRLAPRGLLILDANTLAAYRDFFATCHCREREHCFFAWRGLAAPDLPAGGRAEGILDAFAADPDGSWRRVSTRFVQRHHPHEELSDGLAAAGLEVLAVLGQHDDGRRDPTVDEADHIKRVYLARRS
jgi:SAM-dependent methyltransferase